jgi:hypothetical protein
LQLSPDAPLWSLAMRKSPKKALASLLSLLKLSVLVWNIEISTDSFQKVLKLEIE